MTQSADLALVTRAVHFAAVRHKDQHRKGEDFAPYVNHLAEVAELLADAGADSELIAAGYLHDTIEDTGTTHEELAALFGTRVADLVREVSDDKSLPKDERKRLQIEHAPHLSHAARRIKLADKTSNVRSVIHAPPKDWSEQRLRDYVEWARAVVERIRGADPKLEAAFDRVAQEADAHFAARDLAPASQQTDAPAA
jgi:(p)ppGpp synthase/HD superfamily hydrolase